MDRGKPISDKTLADMLREYEIESRQVKIDGINRRGYFRGEFEDAWKRYLSPSVPPATPATAATKLMNNAKPVAGVAPVAGTTEERPRLTLVHDAKDSDEPETGSYEPDYPELPPKLDRRPRCRACDGTGCPTCQPQKFGFPARGEKTA
jgi:hypothetical protein